MAGSLKATYDLGMLAVFASHQTREDRDAVDAAAEEERGHANGGANGPHN